MNSPLQRLSKNFLSLTVGTAVTRVVNFLVLIYIARHITVADFGQFSYVYAIFFPFAFLINLGLENLIVRQTARHPREASSFLSNIMGVRLISWPIGILLVVLLWLQDSEALWIILFLFGYSFGSAHVLLVSAVFRGLEKMEVQALLLSMQAVLVAMGVVLVLFQTENIDVVAAVYFLAALTAALLGDILLRREGIRPKLHWQPTVWRTLFVLNLPFTVAFVSLVLFERLIVVFLSLFTDKTAVAWFNASYFIFLALLNIPIIITQILFPAMSRTALLQNQTHIRHLYTTTFIVLWVISLPLMIMIVVLAPYIIELTFGAPYAPSVTILRILAFALPFISVTILLGGVLQTIDAQKVAAKAFASGLSVAVALLSIITWLHRSYLLTTLTYTITAVILAGITWSLARKHIQLTKTVKTFSLSIVAFLGMIGILLFVPIGLAWRLALSLFCYVGFLMMSGVLSKNLFLFLKGPSIELQRD